MYHNNKIKTYICKINSVAVGRNLIVFPPCPSEGRVCVTDDANRTNYVILW